MFQPRGNIEKALVAVRPTQAISTLESKVVDINNPLLAEVVSPASPGRHLDISRTKGKGRALTPPTAVSGSLQCSVSSSREDIFSDEDISVDNDNEPPSVLVPASRNLQALLNLHIQGDKEAAGKAPIVDSESTLPVSPKILSPCSPKSGGLPTTMQKDAFGEVLPKHLSQSEQNNAAVRTLKRKPTPPYVDRKDVRDYISRIQDWACACEHC